MMVRCTRSTVKEYKEIRKRAKKICRKKKREYVKIKLETLEEYGAKPETRKFYKEVRQRKTVFQPRVDFCRDKEGNLIGGEVEIRDRWKEYFEELLNMKVTGSEGEEKELEKYINVEPEIGRPTTIQEVIDAIKYLKIRPQVKVQ
jgi:hypothetical protein